MTVRHALLCILCLCAIGATERSALAATSMDEPTQNEFNPGSINLAQPAAKAVADERVPPGNPLWAIPLRSLSNTRDRPLFTPSRRPPAPPAVVAVPHVVQPSQPVARPVEPEHPNLQLLGTVVGNAESIGVFLDRTTQIPVRLKTGEGHSGWILRSVKAREATLEKENQTETLRLPTPKEGSSLKLDNSPE